MAAAALVLGGAAFTFWPSARRLLDEPLAGEPSASVAATPSEPAAEEPAHAVASSAPAAAPSAATSVAAPPAERASAEPAKAEASKRGLERCSPVSAARRLAGAAWPNVVPRMSAPADTDKFKVAFASAALSAVGLEVDPASLDSEQVFQQTRAPYLTSVTPVTGPPGFVPSRFASPLIQSTVVDGPKPFTLGLTKHGIGVVFLSGGGAFHWVTPHSISVPVVASSDSFHGVVLRVIDRPSQIRYGRLTLDGKKETELFTVSEGSVTDPGIAMKGETTVIAFANKRDEARWQLELSMATGSEAPGTPLPLEIPGGVDGDVEAPVLAPFDQSSLLVQWIEGPKRTLKALLLDWELDPIGEPLLVSQPGHVVQSSAVAAWDGKLFSVYTEGAGVGRTLWVSGFDCN